MKKFIMVLIWISLSAPLLASHGGDAFVGGLGGGILGGVVGSAMTQSGKSDSGHGVVRELDKLEGNVRAEFERVYRAIDNVTRDIKDIKESRPTSDYDFEGLKNSINSFKSDIRGIKTSVNSLESRLDKIEDELAAIKASQAVAAPRKQRAPSRVKEKITGPIPTLDSSFGEVAVNSEKVPANEQSEEMPVRTELRD